MTSDRRLFLMSLAGAAVTAGCSGGEASRMPAPMASPRSRPVQGGGFPEVAFAQWTDQEPEYLLYPGDEIDVATPTATELNRSVRVGPDGRISLPLIDHMMAGDRTLSELEGALSQAYSTQLVRPIVEVTLRQAGPLKVWVAGQVRTPGVYDMPGDIDAYQAIVMAGDFLPGGRRSQVALIRRGPGDVRMLKVLDLSAPRAEVVALRRGDILFVPRTTISEIGAFFTQVRDALPIGFSYSLNGRY